MTVQLLTGDCRAILPTLPERSIQCCVTSPPYHLLRAYGGDPGMIGLEPTIDEHIAALVDVFRGVWRVLRDDGTAWLNYGDRYAGSWGNQGRTDERGTQRPINGDMIQQVHDGRYPTDTRNTGTIRDEGIKPKDLIGLPWRIAFALQAEGWYLRSAIVWAKPNPMPESVTDRPTSAYEHIFLLTKSGKYFYDAAAIAESASSPPTKMPDGWDTGPGAHGTIHRNGREKGKPVNKQAELGKRTYTGFNERWDARDETPLTRNARNVWTIATAGFAEAHFATMPPEIPRRCILAGSREGDTILDPFAGAGTTLLVADRLGRNAVGVEVNPEYVRMALKRITNDAPLFTQVTEVTR